MSQKVPRYQASNKVILGCDIFANANLSFFFRMISSIYLARKTDVLSNVHKDKLFIFLNIFL